MAVTGHADAPSGRERCDHAVIRHHAALFGLEPPRSRGLGLDWSLSSHAEGREADELLRRAASEVVVALMPSQGLCEALGVKAAPGSGVSAPAALTCAGAATRAWRRLRTLHPHRVFAHPDGEPVVTAPDGSAAWLWVPVQQGGLLLVGTELALDLVRYRQGDPGQAASMPAGPKWGYANERPVYLYEAQLEGEDPRERHADWWGMAFASVVSRLAGRPLAPVLPGAAVGAVVLTGDDDQAALSCYRRQLELTGDLPLTYFLHPLTKHDATTLRDMARGRKVDLGLHPDALEEPGRYPALLSEQVAWFERLVGHAPRSVRNHGYLNDGYWGHLPAWRRSGMQISSNIPGLDGRVLNGSLLPARVAWEGTLTEHWSLLTAIGDGVLFALGMDEAASAECVLSCGRRIRESGVPGVVVLNLHPENVEKARAMHLAALQLVQEGFLAWTLGECLDWFKARDHSGEGR